MTEDKLKPCFCYHGQYNGQCQRHTSQIDLDSDLGKEIKSDLKACEHSNSIELEYNVDNIYWCRDCGAFLKYSDYSEDKAEWIYPKNTSPTPPIGIKEQDYHHNECLPGVKVCEACFNQGYNQALSSHLSRGVEEEKLGKELYSQLLNYSRYTIIDQGDACVVINPIAQSQKIAKAIVAAINKGEI